MCGDCGSRQLQCRPVFKEDSTYLLSCLTYLDTIATRSRRAFELVAEIRFVWRALDVRQTGRVSLQFAAQKLKSSSLGEVGARWLQRLLRTPTIPNGPVQAVTIWDFAAETFREANFDAKPDEVVIFKIPDFAFKGVPKPAVMRPHALSPSF
jgi:hypothetical protein